MTLIGAILILVGSIVIAIATWGIVKFDDVFLRMHAASKSASFAVVLMLIGAMFVFPHGNVIFKLFLAILLIFLKTPVASQAIARAAYYLYKENQLKELIVDEWHPQEPKKDKGNIKK